MHKTGGKIYSLPPPFALPQLLQGPRTFLQNGDNVRMASGIVAWVKRSRTLSETFAAPRLSRSSDELAHRVLTLRRLRFDSTQDAWVSA